MIKLLILFLILVFIIKNTYFKENLIGMTDVTNDDEYYNVYEQDIDQIDQKIQIPVLTFQSTKDCPILYKLFKDLKEYNEIKNIKNKVIHNVKKINTYIEIEFIFRTKTQIIKNFKKIVVETIIDSILNKYDELDNESDNSEKITQLKEIKNIENIENFISDKNIDKVLKNSVIRDNSIITEFIDLLNEDSDIQTQLQNIKSVYKELSDNDISLYIDNIITDLESIKNKLSNDNKLLLEPKIKYLKDNKLQFETSSLIINILDSNLEKIFSSKDDIIQIERIEGLRFRNKLQSTFYNTDEIVTVEYQIIDLFKEDIDIFNTSIDIIPNFKFDYGNTNTNIVDYISPKEKHLEISHKESFGVKGDFTIDDLCRFSNYCFTKLTAKIVPIKDLQLNNAAMYAYRCPSCNPIREDNVDNGGYNIVPVRIVQQCLKEGKEFTRAKCTHCPVNILVYFTDSPPSDYINLKDLSNVDARTKIENINLQ